MGNLWHMLSLSPKEKTSDIYDLEISIRAFFWTIIMHIWLFTCNCQSRSFIPKLHITCLFSDEWAEHLNYKKFENVPGPENPLTHLDALHCIFCTLFLLLLLSGLILSPLSKTENPEVVPDELVDPNCEQRKMNR